MSSVSGAVKSIQDIMRKDVGVDGDAQRISQMVWMIFLKIYDDREEELELTEPGYRSPIPERYRWRNWASDREGMTGDALVKFVDDLFFALKNHLPTIGEVGRRAKVVRDVFEDTYNYMKSGTLMRQVINKINEIDFNNTADRHTFGAIYEQILKDLQSAGNAGEFYTPRAVTRFIVDRLDPKLGEVVFDPACGTGGFLACAIEHKRQSVHSSRDEARLHDTIRGVEKKALPHMLCVTNMILHGIDTPSEIRHGNMLEKPYRDYGERDRVPVIATNPPFGGIEQDGIEQNFPAHLRTRETADLFVALIIKLLKNGGRAAVVLPDGFLFGEGVKTTLKKTLIEECNLHTIVRLPNGVFNPYTGIKTNILFFTKGTPTKDVWFYEHPYPAGVTSYNKTKPMRFEEFEAEREWWGDEAEGFGSRGVTEQAWKVSAQDVAARGYNLDFKNPHEGEQETHDAAALLARYVDQEKEVATILDQLKQVLKQAILAKSGTANPAPLIENLHIWSRAAEFRSSGERGSGPTVKLYGVNRLRELIIDLAVRGRLVAQDSAAEPASRLISRAKEAIRGQSASNRLRRANAVDENIRSPDAWELPIGWAWTRLIDIAHINPKNTVDDDTEASFVPMPLISNRADGSHESETRRWSAIKKGYTHFANGDVAVAKITPCFENGKAAVFSGLENGIGAGTTELHVARPAVTEISPRYLLLTMKTSHYLRDGEARMTGTAGQKRVSRSYFEMTPFALPPENEQNEIVAKVDELMALCDRLETLIAGTAKTQRMFADSVVAEAIY
jgi:type I restriction enzyme M protein